MSTNPVTCSNCGTENPPGQDFCRKCHQPLTASAEEEVRESLDAQGHEGALDIGGTATQAGGLGMGMIDPPDSVKEEPHEGLPPRRS